MDRKFFVASCLVVLSVILGFQPAFPQGEGDPTKGKTLWQGFSCKMCHGVNGEGKYAGPRAGDGKKAEDWIKQVRTPRQNMPNFSVNQVSDSDLTDMWAYMQSQTKPASFTPLTYTPAQGDSPGKGLYYQKRCMACHGDGKGLVKARFTDKGRTITTADVIKSMRAPAKMPYYGIKQVSDEDAAQITEYLAK